MSPYYPYDDARAKAKAQAQPSTHDTHSVYSARALSVSSIPGPVKCNMVYDMRSVDTSNGPQRRFVLDQALQASRAFRAALRTQPSDQPYLSVPCDPGCPCGRPHAIVNSLMVSADGACRGNGSVSPRASIGVFFRTGSPYNEAHVLPEANATNQRAELYAGITALRAVEDLLHGPLPEGMEHLKDLELLVLKTDSEYLVKGITEWVDAWRVNGWTGARGTPVLNADLFKRLDSLVGAYKHQHGITVKFLHVCRELNIEADGLANRILNDWENIAHERRFALRSDRM